jgi:hypothetical protein
MLNQPPAATQTFTRPQTPPDRRLRLRNPNHARAIADGRPPRCVTIAPVRRRLLDLLTALSLLLRVAVCVMWVRSYWVHDMLRWTRADDAGRLRYGWYREVESGRGHFAWACNAEVYERVAVTPAEAARPVGRWQRDGWQRGRARSPAAGWSRRPNLPWGFHFAWVTSPHTVRREGRVAHWAIAIPAAALPAWRLVRSRRRMSPPGLCHRCGYDLRATPGKCPECGTLAPTPS